MGLKSGMVVLFRKLHNILFKNQIPDSNPLIYLYYLLLSGIFLCFLSISGIGIIFDKLQKLQFFFISVSRFSVELFTVYCRIEWQASKAMWCSDRSKYVWRSSILRQVAVIEGGGYEKGPYWFSLVGSINLKGYL